VSINEQKKEIKLSKGKRDKTVNVSNLAFLLISVIFVCKAEASHFEQKREKKKECRIVKEVS
jgi:hypothetical protein